MSRATAALAFIVLVAMCCLPAPAVILWSEPGARLVHTTGSGLDILGGKVRRSDTNNDALYFKFHVDPLSDVESERYMAGFQLFEGNDGRLGLGNAWEAWAWSAFNTSEIGPLNPTNAPGEFNLNSSHPEPVNLGKYRPYELVRHDVERTIIFKIQYVPGSTDDLVTVWLDPHLSRGWSEKDQPANLTTKFKANGHFDQIHLVHSGGANGGGNGWIFSDMAIATSFDDFVVERYWQTWWFSTMVAAVFLVWVVGAVRIVDRRKYQRQLQRAEQERMLERERARIAQDLHDDLGSSLTRLSLLSGLVKADKDHPEQVEAHASKLSQAADQTVRALEEIVWAVRPGSDTLQSLLDYIAHFANELFDGNSARCRLDLQNDLPAWPLPPDMRHNIFLIVKESLTNAFKHSGAGEVQVRAKILGRTLEISVVDDGKGFNPASLAEGWRNGMGNMRRRAAAMNANLDLQSAPEKGTTMRFSVVLEGEKHPKH